MCGEGVGIPLFSLSAPDIKLPPQVRQPWSDDRHLRDPAEETLK